MLIFCCKAFILWLKELIRITIEEKLKAEILTQYKSIRAFTQDIGVPYSTIDTMLKKGFSGTGVQTVIKMCDALNIDIEMLKHEVVQPKETKINRSFSLDEIELFQNFVALNSAGQQALLEQSRMMVGNSTYKKDNEHHILQKNVG